MRGLHRVVLSLSLSLSITIVMKSRPCFIHSCPFVVLHTILHCRAMIYSNKEEKEMKL